MSQLQETYKAVGKLEQVDMKGQSFTWRTKAPVITVKITTSGGVHSLYINGRIGEENKSFLIDTGATGTMARPEIIKDHFPSTSTTPLP